MHTIVILFMSALVLAMPLAGQSALPYQPVVNWAQIPSNITMGAAMGVAVDQAGHIWVYNRGSHPMIEFDKDGKVLQAWKEDLNITSYAHSAHGLGVGPDGGLWLVDREVNRVWKFSQQGRAEVVIGSFAGRPGNNESPYTFNRPTGVAFDSQGNVYVSDGYKNTRVAKYTASGKFLMYWGGVGTGDGQFNLVHDVTIDSSDRVYVADRGNKRVQVFDTNGKFLAKWENIGVPWGLAYDRWRKVIWMCDGDNGRVSKLSLDGKLLGSFGSNGAGPGQFDQAHMMAVDADGSIYVGETKNSRVQKFALKR